MTDLRRSARAARQQRRLARRLSRPIAHERRDMPGVVEVAWANGDRAFGKGRWFPLKARWRRIVWHWKHRRNVGVQFPPSDWWR